jgi:hypothetical protein
MATTVIARLPTSYTTDNANNDLTDQSKTGGSWQVMQPYASTRSTVQSANLLFIVTQLRLPVAALAAVLLRWPPQQVAAALVRLIVAVLNRPLSHVEVCVVPESFCVALLWLLPCEAAWLDATQVLACSELLSLLLLLLLLLVLTPPQMLSLARPLSPLLLQSPQQQLKLLHLPLTLPLLYLVLAPIPLLRHVKTIQLDNWLLRANLARRSPALAVPPC